MSHHEGFDRQLNLFKGRRQAGRTAMPAREIATHIALADLLRRWIAPGWIWTHFPAGEARPHVMVGGQRMSWTGSRLKRMGLNPGFPDFMFFCIDRRSVFLELKRAKTGRLSEAQEAVADFLVRGGYPYLCTANFKEAVAFLIAHGVVKSRVQVQ